MSHERYKATLWHDLSTGISRPLDTCLLKSRCYTLAEQEFFDNRKWLRDIDYHIEIEEYPRIIEA